MPEVEVSFKIERNDLDHLPQLGDEVGAAVYAYTGRRVTVDVKKPDGSIWCCPEFDPVRHDGNL